MNCPHCATANAAGAERCARCHASLANARDGQDGTPPGDTLDGLGTMLDGSGAIVDGRGAAYAQGHLISGRWRVEELLGAGGMGEVYRVLDEAVGRQKALKRLRPSLTGLSAASQRFLAEAALSQELSHPNLVRTYEVDRDGDAYFFTMELVEGGSLREKLRVGADERASGDVHEALSIVDQVLTGLEHAHAQGVVHRDVKPENILFDRAGQVKLADLGIARLVDEAPAAAASTTSGTPYYMAPEQMRKGAAVDQRADLYSVGVVLFELLTGQLPVGVFRLPGAIRPGIPAALDRALGRALAERPESRFATATEMRAALRVASPGKASAVAPGRRLRSDGREPSERQGATRRAAPARTLVLALALSAVMLVATMPRIAAWVTERQYAELTRIPSPPTPVAPEPATRAEDPAAAATGATPSPAPGLTAGMVLVPAGTYTIGSDDPYAEADEHPQHPVDLQAFWIDVSEVTAEDYASCVASGACSPGRINETQGCTSKVLGLERHPMNCVSWHQASAYCVAHDKRLPTEAEWEAAARHALTAGARASSADDILLSANLRRPASRHDPHDRTAPVPEGAGAVDFSFATGLLGNVAEWTATAYRHRGYDTEHDGTLFTNDAGARPMAVRGASWWDAPETSRITSRAGRPADETTPTIGFRCVREQDAAVARPLPMN